MDPLDHILPELHNWIFRNFTAEDFKEITKISPNWNGSLENSSVMMKKVRLSFFAKPYINHWFILRNEQVKESRTVLNNSSRPYQNMFISFVFPIFDKELLHDLLKFLVALAPKLLKLELHGFTRHINMENLNLLEEINFLKLKVLTLDNVQDEVLNTLLGRCRSLTKLTLKNVDFRITINPIPNLKSFFKRNEALSEIELGVGDVYFRIFFEEDHSEAVSFKLKRLEINNGVAPISNREVLERNLLKFLKTQSQSLETLEISACKSRDIIEHIFNKMPNLKSFRTYEKLKARHLHLKLNENIVDLGIWGEDFKDFEKILSVVPKLTNLKLYELTKEKVEAIARKLPHLQVLVFWLGGPIDGDPVWKLL